MSCFIPGTTRAIVWNETRASERFVPASTFKIANSLIGLEVGAVRDVEEVLPYGGRPQRLKSWEKDMNLRAAIKASNVPVYRELARRIGLERMREQLRRLDYGNGETGAVVDQFWLEGPLAISALEQTRFLRRLGRGELPLRRETMEAVREITLLERIGDAALHGKTGWHWPSDGGQQIGWWVGWVEREGRIHAFALNLDIASERDAARRLPLGRACLAALDILPLPGSD